ncbi:sensor histidine kinase [Sporomusa termitida]|uniref:sensor histidine kinase n=1 Tax=Sporomusa termitida TaxID=2377 RepID=UPI0011862BD5|nr:HAMP domain-containing sensor histidine kinase [Sporomusa termitida]
MGYSNMEGALLVLFFFAIAVAMPLAGFLLGKRNSSLFSAVSWLALCIGSRLLAQVEIKREFIAVPFLWEHVALLAACLLPAAFYRLLEHYVCQGTHVWLARFVRLHVVYAVTALLWVAAKPAAGTEAGCLLVWITAGTGLAAGGIIVGRAVYGSFAARVVAAGLGILAVIHGLGLLAAAGGAVWPGPYAAYWGYGLMVLIFLLLLRRRLSEENASSRRVLARTWRTLHEPGREAGLRSGKAPLAKELVPGEPAEPLPATDSSLGQTAGTIVTADEIARFAHEINSPLGTGIMAASYLGQEVETLTQLYKQGAVRKSDLEKHLTLYSESAGSILANLQTAAELVADFRKPATGGEQRRVFSIAAQLNQVLTALKPRLTQAGHTLELRFDADIRMHGFPGRLQQIIANLVLNSLAHAYEQGEQGHMLLRLTQEDGMAVLEYADDGKGISESTLGHIFDPYFTTKREQGNTGLGLSIIKEIITTRFGGTIECRSPAGKGAIFTIRLPIGELKHE